MMVETLTDHQFKVGDTVTITAPRSRRDIWSERIRLLKWRVTAVQRRAFQVTEISHHKIPFHHGQGREEGK